MEGNPADLADMQRWLDQLDERLAAGQALDAADPIETPDGFDLSGTSFFLLRKVFYFTIADNMDDTWVEETDEHLTIGQETPHGFDLATAIAVPDRTSLLKLLLLELSHDPTELQQIVILPQQLFPDHDLEGMYLHRISSSRLTRNYSHGQHAATLVLRLQRNQPVQSASHSRCRM